MAERARELHRLHLRPRPRHRLSARRGEAPWRDADRDRKLALAVPVAAGAARGRPPRARHPARHILGGAMRSASRIALPNAPSRDRPLALRLFGASALVRAALVVGGATLIALAAQIAIPLPFSPVPVTGQTFAVLLIGA